MLYAHTATVRHMNLLPNRVAVYLTAAAALLGGLAPAVANLDLASTAGIIAGLATITPVVLKWLSGWQDHEHALTVAEWYPTPADEDAS